MMKCLKYISVESLWQFCWIPRMKKFCIYSTKKYISTDLIWLIYAATQSAHLLYCRLTRELDNQDDQDDHVINPEPQGTLLKERFSNCPILTQVSKMGKKNIFLLQKQFLNSQLWGTSGTVNSILSCLYLRFECTQYCICDNVFICHWKTILL